jgi:tetratricopeptide (TPR) repeat protein
LEKTATLLILDNLESLADGRGLHELLDAAALWSEAGQSRVLLTSRQPDFHHPAYPLAGSYAHQALALQGLREDDAVDWFDELRRLPPKSRLKRPRRDVLIRLFKQVDFHPLSISLLAQQLKERGPADVGERLEALLALQPLNREDRSLLASLELSIERLPEHCLPLLNRLGVFAGGGLEAIVEDVTGLEEADWQELRSHLLRAGLMQDERVAVVDKTWLRFHPTLAPALWQKLDKEEQAALTASHWQAYYQLSGELYKLDDTNTHATRAVAKHELPNLLRAVYAALQSSKAEQGVDFAVNINSFLQIFGMRRDCLALAEAAAKAGSIVGSKAWYLAHSNLGLQLCSSGQIAAAEQICQDILTGLDETPSYERCVSLHLLCCCRREQGQTAQAEQLYRQELTELTQIEQSAGVRREIGLVQTDLANVLREQGRYAEAKTAYQAGLEIAEEQGDKRQMSVVLGQLDSLAQRPGKLTEASERHKDAISFFHSIDEPAMEAVAWHKLGMVYQKAKAWEASEHNYRESAQLTDKHSLMTGNVNSGASWHQIARICEATGRLAEGEKWYRKALKAFQDEEDRPNSARTLNNLASLLVKASVRLDEARSLAEESLAIKETLDPAAAEIWTTYNILARIAAQQGNSSQAAAYRAKSRQAYFAFPAWRQQVQQHEPLIAAVVQGSGVEAALARYDDTWANLKAAIRLLLSGERNEAVLCEPLVWEEAAIIRAILEGMEEGA